MHGAPGDGPEATVGQRAAMQQHLQRPMLVALFICFCSKFKVLDENIKWKIKLGRYKQLCFLSICGCDFYPLCPSTI